MDILAFAREQVSDLFTAALTGRQKRDHSANETPVGSGYYAKRKNKGGKYNYKIVVADRSPKIDLRGEGIPLVGPQTEKRRRLLLKRKEARLTPNGRKVA